jgi:hypothetical protein
MIMKFGINCLLLIIQYMKDGTIMNSMKIKNLNMHTIDSKDRNLEHVKLSMKSNFLVLRQRYQKMTMKNAFQNCLSIM